MEGGGCGVFPLVWWGIVLFFLINFPIYLWSNRLFPFLQLWRLVQIPWAHYSLIFKTKELKWEGRKFKNKKKTIDLAKVQSNPNTSTKKDENHHWRGGKKYYRVKISWGVSNFRPYFHCCRNFLTGSSTSLAPGRSSATFQPMSNLNPQRFVSSRALRSVMEQL